MRGHLRKEKYCQSSGKETVLLCNTVAGMDTRSFPKLQN